MRIEVDRNKVIFAEYTVAIRRNPTPATNNLASVEQFHRRDAAARGIKASNFVLSPSTLNGLNCLRLTWYSSNATVGAVDLFLDDGQIQVQIKANNYQKAINDAEMEPFLGSFRAVK